MHPQLPLPFDWKTFQQAAEEKGASFRALQLWIYSHDVPYRKVGYLNVVRMSDLTGYIPRSQKVADLV